VSALNPLLLATLGAATPLVYAALGELVTERAGVLNLGVEGMMVLGALAAFAAGTATGNLWLGFAAAAAAGALLALLFAVLTLSLQASQVASGLALTIFGLGLSALAGRSFTGLTVVHVQSLALPASITGIPVLGTLTQLTVPEYGAIALYILVERFLSHTRAGLALRAAGESPAVAHALGVPVLRIRYLATVFGGAMCGMAGGYLSLALTPSWVEGMSGGRGWIALALVVFATWRPVRVLTGACLFGGVTVLQLYAQGAGVPLPAAALSMLPYLATIVVLVLICRNPRTIALFQPASLGRSFHPDD
jgi:simple sugar transport system permease protein